jgi:magnesium-transporting ATPase (P-type)
LLLLNSNLPKGIANVETKSLDGETNLKVKVAQKNLFEMSKTENNVLCNFDGAQIDCGGPDEFLY